MKKKLYGEFTSAEREYIMTYSKYYNPNISEKLVDLMVKFLRPIDLLSSIFTFSRKTESYEHTIKYFIVMFSQWKGKK